MEVRRQLFDSEQHYISLTTSLLNEQTEYKKYVDTTREKISTIQSNILAHQSKLKAIENQRLENFTEEKKKERIGTMMTLEKRCLTQQMALTVSRERKVDVENERNGVLKAIEQSETALKEVLRPQYNQTLQDLEQAEMTYEDHLSKYVEQKEKNQSFDPLIIKRRDELDRLASSIVSSNATLLANGVSLSLVENPECTVEMILKEASEIRDEHEAYLLSMQAKETLAYEDLDKKYDKLFVQIKTRQAKNLNDKVRGVLRIDNTKVFYIHI